MVDNEGRSDGVAEVTCSLSNAVGSAIPRALQNWCVFNVLLQRDKYLRRLVFRWKKEQSSQSLKSKDGHNASLI